MCYRDFNNNSVYNDVIILSLEKYFKLFLCAKLSCWFEKFFKRHEFYMIFFCFNRCNERVQGVNCLLSQSSTTFTFYVCIKWKVFLNYLKWGCKMTSNCINPQITSVSVLGLGKNEHQAVYQKGFSLTSCPMFYLNPSFASNPLLIQTILHCCLNPTGQKGDSNLLIYILCKWKIKIFRVNECVFICCIHL